MNIGGYETNCLHYYKANLLNITHEDNNQVLDKFVNN